MSIHNLSTEFLTMIEGEFLVLDTETTGLHDGEIVQIALINQSGDVLLDTLVKPIYPIPVDATRIHGITNDMVKDAPGWAEVLPVVYDLLKGKHVVIYNAVYDRKMMHQSNEKAGLPKIDWKEIATFWCAMEAFARVYGEFDSYRGSYRWQKLTTAARYYRIDVSDAHDALGDCKMTLAVCKAMAERWRGENEEHK